MGRLVFKTAYSAVLSTAMTIDNNQNVVTEEDIHSKGAIYLGATQDSGMTYNATEDSLDFFF